MKKAFDYDYEFAFRCACSFGHLDFAKWLLKRKPDIDISWNNDFGVITKIFDNLLDNDQNYFKNIFTLTNAGSVYFRNSNEIWTNKESSK